MLFLVVGFPLVFMMLCEAAQSLRPKGWPPLEMLPGVVLLLSWPIGLSLLQSSAYFASESYILSLILMLAVIPVMAEWENRQPSQLVQLVYSTGFALATFLALLGNISIGSILKAIAFCIVPFLYVFFISVSSGSDGNFKLSPFHFLFDWREQALFYIVFVAIVGMVIAKFADYGRTAGNVFLSLYVMALAGLCVSLLLMLEAGAAIYFADPGMWAGILILASLLPALRWFEGKPFKMQFVLALLVFIGLAALEKDRWTGAKALPANMIDAKPTLSDTAALNLKLVSQIDDAVKKHGRNFLVFVGHDEFVPFGYTRPSSHALIILQVFDYSYR